MAAPSSMLVAHLEGAFFLQLPCVVVRGEGALFSIRFVLLYALLLFIAVIVRPLARLQTRSVLSHPSPLAIGAICDPDAILLAVYIAALFPHLTVGILGSVETTAYGCFFVLLDLVLLEYDTRTGIELPDHIQRRCTLRQKGEQGDQVDQAHINFLQEINIFVKPSRWGFVKEPSPSRVLIDKLTDAIENP